MGALRFKINPEGPFLAKASDKTVPPWTSLGELQKAVNIVGFSC